MLDTNSISGIKHDDLYRRWTTDAIICFDNRCRCDICGLREFCERQREINEYRIKPMKYSVLQLYKRWGPPKKG